jgi:hypothetical protein
MRWPCDPPHDPPRCGCAAKSALPRDGVATDSAPALLLFGVPARPVEPSKGTQWNATVNEGAWRFNAHAYHLAAAGDSPSSWEVVICEGPTGDRLAVGGGTTLEAAERVALDDVRLRRSRIHALFAALTRRSEGGGA